MLDRSRWRSRTADSGSGTRPWWRRLGGQNGAHGTNHELLASVNEVAAAVSSTLSVDEVLESIVTRAKRVTNTDKTVLLLTSEFSDTLDFDTLNVRGARDEHPEEWWGPRVRSLADEVLLNGRAYLDHDAARGAWLLLAPIMFGERPIGLLCAINDESRPFTGYETEYLEILCAFTASAVVNARLAEENRYRFLSSERDRIARAMHDGIAQSLFSISIGLEVCKKQALRGEFGVIASRLEELQDELDASMLELRRVIYDLRPSKLKNLGLVGAVDSWVSEIASGVEVEPRLIVTGEQRALAGVVEACLYWVAKELTSNVVRHASASTVTIEIDYSQYAVVLMVTDDGAGFDVDMAREESGRGGSLGLHSIAERVRAEGGELQIESALGGGTHVRVELPL